jgi:putative transcriptional regulator
MIEYKVAEVLEELNKSAYWLAKETGISYPTIDSIVKNTARGVKFDILDKICLALGKKPGEILIQK